MSEQVTYRVKLKPLTEKERLPVLVTIASLADPTDDIEDYLYENNFQIINNIYYHVIKECVDSDYFVEVKACEDGSYEVFTSFYSGGTCLSEVLEDALEVK